ncbi:MAG: hypothetical protein UZ07_CHB004003198 [Chlorobi bacterium OLB7]|nr:MAG: hypothetical protein UZ07_CHB004003198 [Chlorobi bacterium OLB7]
MRGGYPKGTGANHPQQARSNQRRNHPTGTGHCAHAQAFAYRFTAIVPYNAFGENVCTHCFRNHVAEKMRHELTILTSL